MWVQELFTELKKLAPLLRCDVAKLGPKRSFRGICIGNTPKKIDFQNLKKLITFGQNALISPFLAKLQTKMGLFGHSGQKLLAFSGFENQFFGGYFLAWCSNRKSSRYSLDSSVLKSPANKNFS